jgi:Flp pilus assembly protein TadD
MKSNNPGMRPVKVAAAFGAILLVTGCASSYDPMYAGLPKNLDGGVGQLLRYCSKFQDTGDLVTAAGLCERAHNLEPANPAPLMQLADILIAMNQPEQAMTAYRTIIEAAPQYTDARYALGKMHIARGEYDIAAAQFQAALRYKADDPRLYNALGVAHGLIGANESAMQAFADGLEVAPKYISLRNNMGLALVMDGRHEEGVRMLEAVAADPAANETSHHNLQLAYGLVSAANADAEAAAHEQANSSMPQESMAPVEPVTVEPDLQMAAASPAPQQDATIVAPVALVPELESERALATTGESESPIEVTVREDTPSAGPSGDSPLRVQTARATTGDTMDANAGSASAYMGAYLNADAEIPAPANTVVAPKASEPQVAALQPMAPATSSGDYAVQLASYLSEARAMLGWSELRGAAPDLLDPVSPVVQRADLDGDRGTVYRLRTVPTAKNEAASLCNELKARGIDCLVIKEASGSVPRAG